MDENGAVPEDELVMFYHQEFVNALKTVGYSKSPPTLLDLNLEILKHGHLSIVLDVCFSILQFVDSIDQKVEDLFQAESAKTSEIRKQLYEIPLCKTIFQRKRANE